MPIVWVSLAIALLAIMWLLTAYRGRLAKIRRTSQPRSGEMPEPEPESWPGVSVIVHAQDSSRQLAAMLPAVLQQDYPGDFEVVVVNDGSSRDVTDVVNFLSNTYHNLHITFVPFEAHNLSRTKLGISLGIKAARYPYVICLLYTSPSPRDRG